MMHWHLFGAEEIVAEVSAIMSVDVLEPTIIS